MARYIDADKFLKDQIRRCGCVPLIGTCTMDSESLKDIVEQTPTADVVEVKHGEWIDCIETGTTPAGINISGLVGYKCSLCGRYEGKREPYCNCGAKMDAVNYESSKKEK